MQIAPETIRQVTHRRLRAPDSLGVMVHACNPRIWKVETGGLGTQGHTMLRSEFQVSLGTCALCMHAHTCACTYDTHTHIHTKSLFLSSYITCHVYRKLYVPVATVPSSREQLSQKTSSFSLCGKNDQDSTIYHLKFKKQYLRFSPYLAPMLLCELTELQAVK